MVLIEGERLTELTVCRSSSKFRGSASTFQLSDPGALPKMFRDSGTGSGSDATGEVSEVVNVMSSGVVSSSSGVVGTSVTSGASGVPEVTIVEGGIGCIEVVVGPSVTGAAGR